MVTYSEQFAHFLPVLLAFMIFISLGMLTIWAARREWRTKRIINIEAEAEQIFGSRRMAKGWMSQNNVALGCAPISMLDSARGVAEVRKALASITYGGSV